MFSKFSLLRSNYFDTSFLGKNKYFHLENTFPLIFYSKRILLIFYGIPMLESARIFDNQDLKMLFDIQNIESSLPRPSNQSVHPEQIIKHIISNPHGYSRDCSPEVVDGAPCGEEALAYYAIHIISPQREVVWIHRVYYIPRPLWFFQLPSG